MKNKTEKLFLKHKYCKKDDSIPHQSPHVQHAHHWPTSLSNQKTLWCKDFQYTKCAVFFRAPAAS